jgi:tetratricopeptide (TPR) repeat protein
MIRTLAKLTLGTTLAILASSSDVFAGRGGGGGGRGGGGGGGRGAYGGGGGGRGAYGGGSSMNHSPSFSQPNSASYGSRSQGNAGAAGAGAAYSNRNQSAQHPAGAAAAGADYSNRNQTAAHPAGAAAAGAGYANRNQSAYPNAGAAAVGAGYANRNQYDQYHPGMASGYWNGNYGAWGIGAYGSGGVGAWGVGSPMYGYGYSGYGNPYAGGMAATGAGQQGALAQSTGAPPFDYSQPLNTAAAPAVTDQATAAFDQARDAFKTNDFATALDRDQQALSQTPNDATLHEFLALVLFAQGKYEPAAAPLYAVLSVGPGWDWTTLIGNYADANVYTEQLRALESYVKANPRSAQARFLLAYHYITQGHGDAAAKQLNEVVTLEPNDTLSAQLLGKLQPGGEAPPLVASQAQPSGAAKLTGDWVAQGPQNATINLSIKDGGAFTWVVALPGKPPRSIAGASTVADGVLTLAGKDPQAGALTGQLAWQDDTHFSFRATGAPADDPGLKFAR